MVGGLAQCVGIGQRIGAWGVLCLDGHVALVDLCLQTCHLVIHILLGVVVGEVNARSVHLLPIIYGAMLCIVYGDIPIAGVLSLLC